MLPACEIALGGQDMHRLRLESAKVFGGHAEHVAFEVAAGSGEAVPSWHSMHELDPFTGLNFPGRQAAQAWPSWPW